MWLARVSGMNRMYNKKAFLIGVCWLSAFVTSANAYAASLYELTDLGLLRITQQESQNLKLHINANNQVVGWLRLGPGNSGKIIGFLWSEANGFSYLPSSTNQNQFNAINNARQIAGVLQDANGFDQAVRWNANFTTPLTLGTLGGSSSVANAINSSGNIAGASETASGIEQAFVWSGSTLIPLTLDERQSSADDINDVGNVAGTIGPFQNSQAFYWSGSAIVELNSIDANVVNSWAGEINNLNQMVGGMEYSFDSSASPRFNRMRAFRWDVGTGLTNLGSEIAHATWANAINNSSLVVGAVMQDFINRQALLWDGEIAYNLNVLTQNAESWNLIDATDINDAGNIVGIGLVEGQYRGFLLKPIVASVATADMSINIRRGSPATKPGARALSINASDQLILEAKNQGPSIATDVAFDIDTNMPITPDDVISDNAICASQADNINCVITTMLVGDEELLTLDLTAVPAGEYDITVDISANELDPGANYDNQISEQLTLTKPLLPIIDPGSGDSTTVDKGTEQQTPSDQDSTEVSDPEGSSEPRNDSSTVSAEGAGSGCTVGSNTALDPLLWLLCGLATLVLLRNKTQLN